MDLDELKEKLENKSEAVYPTGDYDKRECMAETTGEVIGYNLHVFNENLAITALTKIAYPIKYLQDEAVKEGVKLDGCAAIALTQDINFYQDIAIKALKEITNPVYSV